MDVLETFTFIGSIFIVVYLFIMQPHQVSGRSMDNTFHDKQLILTSKITYRFREPERGDVVVFNSPTNPDIDYIKRVIGLPGDKVRINNGEVFVNGIQLQESYINPESKTYGGTFLREGTEVEVPPQFLFVMGDNRAHSSDSREFAFIPYRDVDGEVFFRYFPLDKIGSITNPYR
ncbi:MAG: Signal peptidase IB [Microgenomates bacterium OLB22]|nr:MAG: Signal peptidase IB [Microgenomates bacterium OLB22]